MKLPINQWSEDDRPREKLLSKGINALSDAELIAILIGSGNKNESAVDLSKRILAEVENNLLRLGTFKVSDFIKFKGIGKAKAISIVAALELGRRRNLSKAFQQKEVRSSQDAFQLFSPKLSDKQTEEFWVIYLKKNTVSGISQISKGGLDSTLVDVRLLMIFLLEKETTAFIIAHNHPSGNISPSENDKHLTRKIKEAAKILNMQLLDHLIIGKDDYFSFADKSIL